MILFSGFCLLAAAINSVNGLSSSASEPTGVVKMVYPLVPGFSRKSHNHFRGGNRQRFEQIQSPKKVKSVKTAKSRSSLVDKISYDVLGPVKSYDRDFMGEWWKMMRQLWTADGEANGIRSEMPSSAVDFLPARMKNFTVPTRSSLTGSARTANSWIWIWNRSKLFKTAAAIKFSSWRMPILTRDMWSKPFLILMPSLTNWAYSCSLIRITRTSPCRLSSSQ